MATRKRHSPEQIVRKLMAADRLLAEGRDTAEVCRELGVSEAALVFTSGYAANVGTISALARPGDLLISDELKHASLIDGPRIARNDPGASPIVAVADEPAPEAAAPDTEPAKDSAADAPEEPAVKAA